MSRNQTSASSEIAEHGQACPNCERLRVALSGSANTADEYAKRAWATNPPAQEAAIAAEHIAASIRRIAEDVNEQKTGSENG